MLIELKGSEDLEQKKKGGSYVYSQELSQHWRKRLAKIWMKTWWNDFLVPNSVQRKKEVGNKGMLLIFKWDRKGRSNLDCIIRDHWLLQWEQFWQKLGARVGLAWVVRWTQGEERHAGRKDQLFQDISHIRRIRKLNL